MRISKLDNYGESEFPEIYWQIKIEEYLDSSNYYELELAPKLFAIEKDEIVFQLSGVQKEYRIPKVSCKRHLPSITSDSVILTRHFIEIPFIDQKRKVEVYSEVESDEQIDKIIDKIIKNNPHWNSNILSEEQLAQNIFHVLSFYFEKVYM